MSAKRPGVRELAPAFAVGGACSAAAGSLATGSPPGHGKQASASAKRRQAGALQGAARVATGSSLGL